MLYKEYNNVMSGFLLLAVSFGAIWFAYVFKVII